MARGGAAGAHDGTERASRLGRRCAAGSTTRGRSAGAADAQADELGETMWHAGGRMSAWEVETLAGDASAAEASARLACERLEELGDSAFLPLGGSAARVLALHARSRRRGGHMVTHGGRSSKRVTTSSRTCSGARSGRVSSSTQAISARPRRVGQEAVQLGAGTDMLNAHASALDEPRGGSTSSPGAKTRRATVGKRASTGARRRANLALAARVRATLDSLAAALVTEPTGD